jgi:ribosomal protein L16 Arg81 hydroxylase
MRRVLFVRRAHAPIISPDEVAALFASGELHQSRSFFIIEKDTGTYDTRRVQENFIAEAQAVAEAFRSGSSIIVKNLEHRTAAIRRRCAELGPRVDVHLYLVPPAGGSSFDFHTDDRDVLVHLAYGRKRFVTREQGPEGVREQSFELAAGDELFIPQGVLHRAIPQGASCLLSFGIPRDEDYPVPGGITVLDLGTSRAGS